AADRDSDLRLGGAVYMAVGDPARFIDLSQPNRIGRTVEVCATPLMRDTPPCQGLGGRLVAWDDPRSPFKGASRQTRLVDSFRMRNGTGVTRWYSDPFGGRLSMTPFAGGVLQQYIGTTNGLIAEYYASTVAQRNYAGTAAGGATVRAPN
nr:hypothetical protein [Gemmatimonadaceae bacterium]